MVKIWEWKGLLNHPLVCQEKDPLEWVNIIEIVIFVKENWWGRSGFKKADGAQPGDDLSAREDF